MKNLHPERHLKVPGTSNFRDIGGYKGADGRHVRWRVLFRSDHLANLTDQGVTDLHLLGITRSIDLRGESERAANSYKWPLLAAHSLPVEPTLVQEAMALIKTSGNMNAAQTVALMQETYRSFVHANTEKFAQLFQLLLAHQTPTLVHCTAGKDRTGWAVALILEVLGVAREDIERDYLLTNQYYQQPNNLAVHGMQTIPKEILNVLWQVQPSFLTSAYQIVDQEFGGIAAYMQHGLRLDACALRALRNRYLEA